MITGQETYAILVLEVSFLEYSNQTYFFSSGGAAPVVGSPTYTL